MQTVEGEISRLITFLRKSQSPEGCWRFCLEDGVRSDAYMIILFRTLQIDDPDLIRKLANRILLRQEANGAWKLYYDEEDGNLSSTIEAYYALLFSGFRKKDDPNMLAAKAFILSKGGIDNAGLLTKILLSLTGQVAWPSIFVPVEFILLPSSFPINFFDFVGYARVHVAPMLILANRKFSLKTETTPNLSDLFSQESARMGFHHLLDDPDFRALLASIKEGIKNLPYLPQHIHHMALLRCEQFMLKRIEPDGTLYCYFTSTFLMIFALLALRYSPRDPVITQAINGLKKLAWKGNDHAHIQLSDSTVWDTALLSYSLQEAGLRSLSTTIIKSDEYLLARQQKKAGDWQLHNPSALPGGWGFSDYNTINPDVDDTTAALRALKAMARSNPTSKKSWNRGLEWVLSLQNSDGGWPAFEKNTDMKLFTLLPIEGSDSASIDPSSADLTGRTLQFLGHYAGFTLNQIPIRRGVNWLLKAQEDDGSWRGVWGICYTYGTWAAVTGLLAVGIPANHKAVQKALRWILSTQNDDGGWGESCKSDQMKRYVPLGKSTPSQTAWMVDALIAISPHTTQSIEKGIHYLIESAHLNDWTVSYPTGAALPGGFYFNYHSYRYIWPLLALGHYKNKYLD